MKKIIFVDRDGTILKEPEDQQVDTLEKVAFVEGAILGLKDLQNRGWELVLISNQDGLGTGNFPHESFDGPQLLMLNVLKSCGIEFSDILICPHFERDGCACRKPRTGLLQHYLNRGFDRSRSAVIGDRETDLQLGEALAVRGYRLGPRWSWSDIVFDLTSGNRRASRSRKTSETGIEVSCDLDRFEKPDIHTGLPFFDHMLEQIAIHAGILLKMKTVGDWHVDDHHAIEDSALALGEVLREALGDKYGVNRYGFVLPMDESLADCALDLSGRPYCSYSAPFTRDMVGGLATEMISHFFGSLAVGLQATLHLKIAGTNNHHMAEAGFKAFGRCLRDAIALNSDRGIPSSKGQL